MSLQTPKANNSGQITEKVGVFNSPSNQKGGRSILYTLDSNGGGGTTEYFHKNNAGGVNN